MDDALRRGDRPKGTKHRAPERLRFALTAALVTGMMVSLAAPLTAAAGPGSLISGAVWADTNRDSVRQPTEVAQGSVTVELLTSPGLAVVATTTTGANGTYSFPNAADGTYVLRATAPGPFGFAPPPAAGANDFTSAGIPSPGQPQQGVTAPLVIAGATQLTGVDAGLRPIADIQVAQLAMANACEGLVTTGTPPFDASDGASLDSNASNCLVRTNDQTVQQYAVSLTGLPTGAQVDNVVAEFVISSADGARARFSGPGAGGLPTGCLVSGVTPVSSIVFNADGSVTLRCNMGTFTSAVKPIQIPLTAANTSVDGSHLRVTVNAQAAQGGAGASNTVVGPDVQVTGQPRWDLAKGNYGSHTTVTTRTIAGVSQQGYLLQYWVSLAPLGSRGVTALTGPLTFVDRVIDYPGAVAVSCRMANNGNDGQGYTTPGTITCPPAGEVQGADGFSYTVNGFGADISNGYIIQFFVPLFDAYRKIQPSWQPGDPIPTGSAPVSNNLVNTQGWVDSQGNLNNTTGFEPGWNGTTASGNNAVVNGPLQVAPPVPGIPGSGKSYFSPLGGCCAPTAAAGNLVGTRVRLNTDGQTTVVNPTLVDVFDVSVWRLEGFPDAQAGYVLEYAQGPNSTDLQTGPRQPDGTYPFDTSTLRQAAATANSTFPGPWVTDPTTFGPDWRETVNMVRKRPIDPATVLGPSSFLDLVMYLRARATYNGGPHAGESIPAGVRSANEGGWTDPTIAANWSTNEALLTFIPLSLGLSKTPAQPQYLPGDSVRWTIRPSINAGGPGAIARQVVVTDTLPAALLYDPVCTLNSLPAGVTVSFNPQTRVLTFNYGDVTIGQTIPWPLAALTVCTTVSTVTPPGTVVVNPATVSSIDSTNTAAAQGAVTINGTGQLAIQKSVDRSLVRPGEPFTWSITWSNTTGNFDFQPTDMIDVLAWNGDGAPGSLSPRSQFDSDFAGTHGLSSALAAPTYTAGGTGAVPGTWYYATAASNTVNQDPRAAANVAPAPDVPGGLWMTQAEIAAGPGFGAVTAVRFVAADLLLRSQTVRAQITESTTPAVENGRPVLNDVFVNRAQIFSQTFPTQPLLSNEPYVLIPGWSIGDLVWRDDDGDGRLDPGESGLEGVPIEIVDGLGAVMGTATTDTSGRWIVEGLPAGTFTVRIPASAFAAGAVLDGFRVDTVGATTDLALGESAGNKNTATPNPAATGLTSSPVTFAYVLDGNGTITGGNQPASGATDPGGLSNPMVPAGFKNLNMDLALAPIPAIDLQKSAAPNTDYEVGQEIQYSFVVTNSGDTTLADVTVSEDAFTGSGDLSDVDCPVGAALMAPGAEITCTATYTTTQADVDRGTLVNRATALGSSPALEEVVSPQREVVLEADQDPEIDLEKSVTAPVGSVWEVDQVIEYAFLVTNTGNVTLTDIRVDDVQIAPAGPLTTGPNCPVTVLAPGASTTCVATYTVAAPDLLVESIDDRAIAHGTAPSSADVASPERFASVPVELPSIDLVKSASPAADYVAGQQITYSFLVTNTGNVPLTNVTVTEDSFTGDGAMSAVVCPPGAALLPAGDDIVCTATYTANQEDVDRGTLVNQATAHGLPPHGSSVDSPRREVVVPADREPSIDLVKSASPSDAANYTVGQLITYSFVVTNTGNMTLTNVTVSEDYFTGAGQMSDVVCPPEAASLAPGDQLICTATYTLVQADLDRGTTVNRATAHGTPRNGPVVDSPEREVEIPSDPEPAITLLKSVSSPTGSITRAGQAVQYSFLVTNTGNVTLHDVAVSESEFNGNGTISAVDCPDTELLPGEQMTCTASYTTTASDLTLAQLSNTARATGTTANGPVVTVTSSPSSAIVPIIAPPPPGIANTGGQGAEVLIAFAAGLGTLGIVLAWWGRRRLVSPAR